MPIIDSTYFWLILAVALGVLEACTSALVCIWFVVGSVFAFAVSFITDSIIAQMAVFSVASGVCLAVTRPMAKKVLGRQPVATNADMIIGKTCTVTEDIHPEGKGRVKADGQSWMAQCDVPLEKGRQAQICEIRGATLIVKPITENIM